MEPQPTGPATNQQKKTGGNNPNRKNYNNNNQNRPPPQPAAGGAAAAAGADGQVVGPKRFFNNNRGRGGGGGIDGGGEGGGAGAGVGGDSAGGAAGDNLLIPAPKTRGRRGGGGNVSASSGAATPTTSAPPFPQQGAGAAGSGDEGGHATMKKQQSAGVYRDANNINNNNDGDDGDAEGKSNRQIRYERYQQRRQDIMKQRREDNKQNRQNKHASTTAGSGSGENDMNNNSSRGSSTHARDPLIEHAANSLTFPSAPSQAAATVEDLAGPMPASAPAVSRAQGGGAAHGGGLGPTHPSRTLFAAFDPGHAFPSAPFVSVGDITAGSILKAYASSSQHAVANPNSATVTASPKFAHFSALTPMEAEAKPSSVVGSYNTHVYRSSNRFSGSLVCLRRVVACAGISAERCQATSDYLRHFRHPNLAQLNSVTATSEFTLGSSDVLLEYRYVKGARNLAEVVAAREELTESCIWSIACQLLSLTRHFHECEVPLRGLHISKLLLVQDLGDGVPSSSGGSQRVVWTGLGLVDVLGTADVPPHSTTLSMHYRSDVQNIGAILSQLVHGSLNIDRSANVQNSPLFTPALFALVRACKDGGHSAAVLCRALGERMASELAASMAHSDYLMSEAVKEIHCGRVMKLLMRLNFAFAASMQPQQTHVDFDSLFVVRLFFQHLFAQVDEHGTPQLDWGLVYHGLNKVDVGSHDLVQLVSEQDHTLFVVSYKDVARCIEILCDGLANSAKEAAALAVMPSALGGMVMQASSGSSVTPSPVTLATPHSSNQQQHHHHNNSNHHHHHNHQQRAAAAAAVAAATNNLLVGNAAAVSNLLAGIAGLGGGGLPPPPPGTFPGLPGQGTPVSTNPPMRGAF